MIESQGKTDARRLWVREKLFLGQSETEYVKRLFTPFNVVAGLIVLVGLCFVVLRFSTGLASVTTASDDEPWGLFLCFGLFCGVPLSATGYVLGTGVYLFGLKRYHPVLKNAILIGLLGYLFAVIFLLTDLGRPWRIYYPMFVSWGTASVLFLVGWHVTLYLSCQFLEFSPELLEWLDVRTLRRWVMKMMVGLTIFGVMLSTLHQSALGALFLLMPAKVHPLWYTPYLPWLFFVSSIAAGLAMVMFVSLLNLRFFKDRADAHYLASLDNTTLGLGKAASFVLLTYFGLKMVALAHGNHWDLLATSWGYWFLVEIFVFVLLPCILFLIGVRNKNVGLVRFTALLTIIGIIVNRLNVSLITFNWHLPHRELLDWKEIPIVIAFVTIEILLYRWIVTRMPILRDYPE
jgi:Ni/Fe-hydrogenase subunit HybB-like protein